MVVIGAILIVAAVFLVIVVLMQHGKSHNLSGTIAGASETFFGKTKASTIDSKLSVATSVVAVVFVLLVLVAYLMSGNPDTEVGHTHSTGDATTAVTTAATSDTGTSAETTSAPAEETTEAPVETTEEPAETPAA